MVCSCCEVDKNTKKRRSGRASARLQEFARKSLPRRQFQPVYGQNHSGGAMVFVHYFASFMPKGLYLPGTTRLLKQHP
jgi:hypothetical protein